MGTTLDGNKLKQISVTGKGLTANLVETCTKAAFSASNSQVTELSLTFLDTMDLQLFRSGVLASGATVNYGGWNMIARVISLGSGPAGPELTVKAPSIFVERLRGQTGGHSWGQRDVSGWARDVAAKVGMKPIVQPGLGHRTIVRAASDGDNKESTWDVLASVAKAVGCWLFEYGPTLVMAKPSWLVANAWGGRYWPFYWNNWSDYSDGLAGMPAYSKDPSQNPAETLTLSVVAADADSFRPGDTVDMSGSHVGDMKGKWIVTEVKFPMTVSAVVNVTCVRPIDPVIPPENKTKGTAGKRGKTTLLTQGRNVAVVGVDTFVSKYLGVSVDVDGSFGAQCVDLVARYNSEAINGPAIGGNGNQWYGNPAANSAYVRISANSPAAKGDIACWGSFYGGGYGHVAIVLTDNGGSLEVLTQNPGPAHKDTLSKQGLQGYLRPKKWDTSPHNTGSVKWN